MKSTKSIILADGPRLLREMLRRVIDKTDHLEVVREVTDGRELPQAIEKFDPEWVIISTPFRSRAHSWVPEYPSVRFIFLSPSENRIKMKWQTSYEANYSDLSLKDFIQMLEKDLQHT
jgi:DNA-binding NarL/FixJ family response regulator